MIRARVGFSRRPDGYVRTLGYAVHDRMDGNPHFPNPPVKLSDLKAALISFDHAIAAAVADRGKKAFAQKKKCRHVVATMLRQLGHYVEAACDGNLAAFVSSGFEPIRSPGATEPCPKPRILKIRQGKTGELLVYFTPLYRKAVHYELRHGAQSADGMLPETWTVESLLQARRPARIENLTPGTIYLRVSSSRLRKDGRLHRLERLRHAYVHLIALQSNQG